MTHAATIASVTVAFNGEEFLDRHLTALLGQTRPLDEVIVVNNASSDRTARILRDHFPAATVIDLPENAGVGGGLSAGLSYAALQKQYDWVWTLDQDSVPEADGLERLLGGLQYVESDTAILAPLCVNSEAMVSYPGLVWRKGWRSPDPNQMRDPVFFVDSVISSGTLVRREAVKAVGLPREDFFMDFVDHEYCLRLREAGYKIAVVSASRLEHEIGSAQQIKHFGFQNAWPCHVPWREYYMTRNEVFTIWKYHPNWQSKWATAARLLRHAGGIGLYGKEKRACLRMMYRGWCDGLAGKLGIRIFERP
jgi:GT2 family glycosyltransferase